MSLFTPVFDMVVRDGRLLLQGQHIIAGSNDATIIPFLPLLEVFLRQHSCRDRCIPRP